MIKIDKDVAPDFDLANYSVPSVNPGPKSKYPFAEMNLGDSFFIPKMSGAMLRAKARMFEKTKCGKGKQFAVQYSHEEGGSRCWLIGIDNEA